jgi:hypothetical protein
MQAALELAVIQYNRSLFYILFCNKIAAVECKVWQGSYIMMLSVPRLYWCWMVVRLMNNQLERI